jgi:integrase
MEATGNAGGPRDLRFHFVTADEARKVLAACHAAENRLLFALARYGGLRLGEMYALTWRHVDFEGGRLAIPNLKLFPSTSCRVLPLFDELRPYLDESARKIVNAFGSLQAHNPLLTETYQLPNLLRRFAAINRRAGLDLWPNYFHSLRRSRATELLNAADITAETVADWLGHSRPNRHSEGSN